MKTLYAALRLALATAALASIAACADTSPRQADMDYRSRPLDSPSPPSANGNPNSTGQRLTIQSGEGERLNLPWFIEGAQDWVNRQ